VTGAPSNSRRAFLEFEIKLADGMGLHIPGLVMLTEEVRQGREKGWGDLMHACMRGSSKCLMVVTQMAAGVRWWSHKWQQV